MRDIAKPLDSEAPLQSLGSVAEGNCVTGGGGGEYQGLPTDPVLTRSRPRRVFLGLDWSTSPASGPLWRDL